MEHLLPHYANKFDYVECDDRQLKAFLKNGKLAVHLVIDGAGNVKDLSEKLGLPYRHDLSPIPKDARCKKRDSKGNLSNDELHDERLKLREKFLDSNGVVQSCEELSAKGWKFDDKQKLLSSPE